MPERTPAPPAQSDRTLLFGILAFQNAFIGRDALLAAMQAWLFDQAKPLGQILLEQGALDAERHALLEALVRQHLKQYEDDPQKSLASVSSIESLREQLKQIADADLHASLAHVSTDRKEDEDPYASRASSSVGTPTSSGLRFRILRPHAKGGLGQVSVALDEELRREVALKEIQNHYADDPHSRTRFVLEAEVTGGLEHPGIVPVYGLGCYDDGRPFYAMRFIKGDSLKDAIAKFHAEGAKRDPGERALALRALLGRFVDVCNAVAYAHARGVLHRDLKPGNVMLGKYSETLVVDWGLAKVTGRSETSVESGEAHLTPAASAESGPTQMGSALGTPELALQQADYLVKSDPGWVLSCANVYALAHAKTGDEKQAARAVELLRRAVAGGFRDATFFKRNPFFDSLRGRADFRKLLTELEAKAKE